MVNRFISESGAADFVVDIANFHRRFELSYNGPPRTLDAELFEFRYKFMLEELTEYVEGYALNNLEQQLDALVDLIYVALGTAYLQGFPIEEAWRRVHEKNMQKVRTLRAEDSKRGSVYDVTKPPGWEPPDHSDLVRPR